MHHFICLEGHIITFDDYGYTFICHLENEDRKKLKQIVASMPRDNKEELEIHGGVGEIGVKIVKMAQWQKNAKVILIGISKLQVLF